MSDTPRTDGKTYMVPPDDVLNYVEGLSSVVSADFACQLERENKRLSRENAELRKTAFAHVLDGEVWISVLDERGCFMPIAGPNPTWQQIKQALTAP